MDFMISLELFAGKKAYMDGFMESIESILPAYGVSNTFLLLLEFPVGLFNFLDAIWALSLFLSGLVGDLLNCF